MAVVPKTQLIHAPAAGATGAGSVYRNPEKDLRTHVPFQVGITVSTATVTIEGRINQNEGWVVLATLTASDIVLVPSNLEYRANITASAGTTVVRVSTDVPILFVA